MWVPKIHSPRTEPNSATDWSVNSNSYISLGFSFFTYKQQHEWDLFYLIVVMNK